MQRAAGSSSCSSSSWVKKGPTAEERMQAQAKELQRQREEYQQLSHTFQQLSRQVEQRDAVQHDRLQTVQQHTRQLERRNQELAEQVTKLKTARRAQHAKEKEVRREMDAAVHMLEAREGHIESELEENNAKTRRVEAEMLVMREQLSIYREKYELLLDEKNTMNRVMEHEMVPLQDLEKSVSKFDKYQEMVQKDTVSMEAYDVVCRKLESLKKVMDVNFVSVDEHDDLSRKCRRLEARLQDSVSREDYHAAQEKANSFSAQLDKMVSRVAYTRLQQEANAVLEKEMLLEASVQVLKDDKEEAMRSEAAARQEVSALQQQLDDVALKLRERELELEEAKTTSADHFETVQHLESVVAAKETNFVSSKDENASLTVALGNCKAMLHREMANKAQQTTRAKELEQHIEQLEGKLKQQRENHAGEVAALRAEHSAQVMQYESKCAELISVVDILKYHMSQLNESEHKNDSTNLVSRLRASGSLDKHQQIAGKTSGDPVGLSSPYKDLLAQYLNKPTTTSSRIDNVSLQSPLRSVSDRGLQYTSTSSHAPQSSPDIYPRQDMPADDVAVSTPRRSTSGDMGGASLASLCASFKSHMTESSKLFTNEL